MKTVRSHLYADDRGVVVETINPDADTVEFCSQGGGFVKKMGHGVFHTVFKPYTSPGFHLAKFTGYDWLPEGFTVEGYTDGTRWNGWACPHFTKEQALTLLPAMGKAEDGQPDLKFEDDKFFIRYYPEADWFDIEPETITVNGQTLTVYRIGDGWCWDTAE